MIKNFEELVKSYIKISKEIIDNELGITSIDDELLVFFEKEEFHDLLQNNNDETVANQMKFWRRMGFLDVDKKEKRYAKKVKVKNSWIRKFVVNLKPYFIFKEIIEIYDEETIFKLYSEHETLVRLFPQRAQEKIIIKSDKLYLDNEYFRSILAKKSFIPTNKKLKYMKHLGLIVTDNDSSRFTKTVLLDNKTKKKILLRNIW